MVARSQQSRRRPTVPQHRSTLGATLAFLEAKCGSYWRRGYKPDVAWGSLMAWNTMMPEPLPDGAVTELFAEHFDRRGTLPYLTSWRRQREAQP
jgi:hypothetical protein